MPWQCQTVCSLTSGISPRMDPPCGTAALRVSVRPRGWQKPFRGKKKFARVKDQLFKFMIMIMLQKNLSLCAPLLLSNSATHLFTQPHLSRYYGYYVHFHHQQHAIEHKTGENFISYHGCHGLSELSTLSCVGIEEELQEWVRKAACVKLQRKVRVHSRGEAALYCGLCSTHIHPTWRGQVTRKRRSVSFMIRWIPDWRGTPWHAQKWCPGLYLELTRAGWGKWSKSKNTTV